VESRSPFGSRHWRADAVHEVQCYHGTYAHVGLERPRATTLTPLTHTGPTTRDAGRWGLLNPVRSGVGQAFFRLVREYRTKAVSASSLSLDGQA
jgi:hypothetical protein